MEVTCVMPCISNFTRPVFTGKSPCLKLFECSLHITYRLDAYALNTAKLYVELYEWFLMFHSIHKVLVHSEVVIKHFLLPTGQITKNVQESRIKDVKYHQEHDTRKISQK